MLPSRFTRSHRRNCLCLSSSVGQCVKKFPNSSWKSEMNSGSPDHLGSENRVPPVLWDTVGCDSKHPVLRCQPSLRNKADRPFNTTVRFHDFKNIMYLNSALHNSCSLVGSSGNLKNHAYGEHIDNSSIVIRINNPPVKGYEQFVGTDQQI